MCLVWVSFPWATLLVFVDTCIRFIASNNTPYPWGADFGLGLTWVVLPESSLGLFMGRLTLFGFGVLFACSQAGVEAV